MVNTRRDILKKLIAAIATSFAKPIQVLPASEKLSTSSNLKGVAINIKHFNKNDWFNIFSTLTNSKDAKIRAQKAEQQLSSIKINDSLAKAIVNYSARNGDTFADYIQESLLDKVPANINLDSDDVDQFIGQPMNKAMEFLRDPKYYSAGDIYFYSSSGEPTILYSADRMVEKGLFRGDNELINAIDSVIDNAIKAVKSEMIKDKKAKSYAKSIEYSPADYLGGAPAGGSEQHGFKLAVDHHCNDVENLIALYEKLQQQY